MKKLSPWLIFLRTFLSKRLLHPTRCSLLKHIWLTGAPSVTCWVISFQQRGANGEEWRIRYSIFYLWWHQGSESLLEMESSSCVARFLQTVIQPAAVSALSKHWLLHFQGPNLCKQSLFSLSFKLISPMNITFQRWTQTEKKKSPAILMPAVAAWPYKRNKAAIQTQIRGAGLRRNICDRDALEEYDRRRVENAFLGENPQPACGFAQFAAGCYSRNLGIYQVPCNFSQTRLTVKIKVYYRFVCLLSYCCGIFNFIAISLLSLSPSLSLSFVPLEIKALLSTPSLFSLPSLWTKWGNVCQHMSPSVNKHFQHVENNILALGLLHQDVMNAVHLSQPPALFLAAERLSQPNNYSPP